MRRTWNSFLLVLSACAVAVAQVELPIGKDMDRYVLPIADTIHYLEEGLDSLPAPGTTDFGAAIKGWTDDKSVASVVVDTANRVLRYSTLSQGVAAREQGVVVRTELTYPSNPSDIRFERWEFDGQGRRIRLVFGDKDGTRETNLDTIRYDWTREGCPDEEWAGTRRVWTVDADGRCLKATLQVYRGADWVDTGMQDLLAWSSGRLVAASRIEIDGADVDTIVKSLFTHDADGNWTGLENYTKDSKGAWKLDYRAVHVWSAGRFSSGKDEEYDAAGNVVWALKMSAQPFGSSAVGMRKVGALGIGARWIDGEVEFANSTDRSVKVFLATPDGRGLGELDVAAGGVARRVSPVRGGVVVWSSNSGSGKLVVER